MKAEIKEDIERKLYLILRIISYILEYERLDKSVGDVKLSIICTQYALDDINKLLEEEEAVKDE